MDGIAAFLTIRDEDNSVLHRVQNFYVNSTVDGYEFFPFLVDGMSSSISSSQESITVTMPLTKWSRQIANSAIAQDWIFELELQRTDGTATAGRVVIAGFTGEVLSASGDDYSFDIEVGISLNPVKSQVPPRLFREDLVGEPPKA